jgi:hypothetical protein
LVPRPKISLLLNSFPQETSFLRVQYQAAIRGPARWLTASHDQVSNPNMRQPGATSDHQGAILVGIDTTGTEGAALLVTSKSGVEELTKALSQDRAATQSGKIRSFQALVSVDVKKGYQVLGARLIAIH